MIEEHFEETKKQLNELADKIMLDDEDLEIDGRSYAALRQKAENLILSDYLLELANNRLEDLEVYVSNESSIEEYRSKTIDYLRDLVREKL